MIILAVATEITLLQEKLNLPRYCIGKFFFYSYRLTIYPKNWEYPLPRLKKSTSGWRASDKNVFA